MLHRSLCLSLVLAVIVVATGCSSAAPAQPGSTSTRVVPSPTQVSPAPGAPKPAAGQPATLRKISVDFAAKSPHYGPHFIAIDKGYYAEEGIELEVVQGNLAAVLAGQTQFTTSPSSLLSAILKGADMKIVYTNVDRPIYELWSSRPDVKTLKDLVGKQIGTLNRGDTMELSMRLLLAKAGLDPSGVVYTPLGNIQMQLAALDSGSVAATFLTAADVLKLKESGAKGNLVVDVGKEVKMLFVGVGTSDKLIREDPRLVEGFLRATIKGREYFKRYKDETIGILGKYNGAARGLNEAGYLSALAAMTDDGTLADDVQVTDAKVRAGVIDVQTIRPMSEIYDYSFVKRIYAELKSTGWQPQR